MGNGENDGDWRKSTRRLISPLRGRCPAGQRGLSEPRFSPLHPPRRFAGNRVLAVFHPAQAIPRGCHAPPSVLPDISPSRGEIGRRVGFRQSPQLQECRRRWSDQPAQPTTPASLASAPAGGWRREARGCSWSAAPRTRCRNRLVRRSRPRSMDRMRRIEGPPAYRATHHNRRFAKRHLYADEYFFTAGGSRHTAGTCH